MSRRVGSITNITSLLVIVEVSNYRPRLSEVLTVHDKPGVKLFVKSYKGEFEIACLNLLDDKSLVAGDEVVSNGLELQLPVGKPALGRVFNALGEVIDGGAPIGDVSYVSLNRPPELSVGSTGHYQILETGIKAIDFLTPFVKGRRIGIIGGAGVGKTVLTTEMIHNVANAKTALSFFVGIGERIREGHELYYTLTDRKLIDSTIMYFGQMDENAATRSLVGRSASAVAGHFRDKGNDVLFFVDNIYRFVQAHNELATLEGTLPSEGGYQASLFSDLHRFEDSLYSTDKGSITSVQSIFIPADDLSDPAVQEISQQLDSVIVLSRDVFESGIFPAVDLLATTSSLLSPEIIGQRHYDLVRKVKAIMRKYDSLKTIIAIVGKEELSVDDQADYRKAEQLVQFFSQTMFVTEELTGKKGEFVKRDDTLAGVEKILNS